MRRATLLLSRPLLVLAVATLPLAAAGCTTTGDSGPSVTADQTDGGQTGGTDQTGVVDQYTVGVEAGEVVIFHGEDIVELTGIDVNALPPYLRDRVDATILAENLEAAHTMVEDLRTEVQPASSPTP